MGSSRLHWVQADCDSVARAAADEQRARRRVDVHWHWDGRRGRYRERAISRKQVLINTWVYHVNYLSLQDNSLYFHRSVRYRALSQVLRWRSRFPWNWFLFRIKT